MEKFDYNKHRNETTVAAIAEIFKILGENAESIAFKTDEKTENINDVFASLAGKVIEVFIKHKVPDKDMQYITESCQVVIFSLFNAISRQKSELEKELMARTIGQRDPGTNKLSKEYSTIEGLFHALEKARIEQDTESNQYFYVGEEAVPMPEELA